MSRPVTARTGPPASPLVVASDAATRPTPSEAQPMVSLRLAVLVIASLAMVWRASLSARQAYAFYRDGDLTNTARRLAVTIALGVLGGGVLVFLSVRLISSFALRA